MSNQKFRIPDYVVTTGIGYLVILAVAILGLQTVDPGINRVIAIVAIISFTILFARMPGSTTAIWKRHIYMGSMTALVTALLFMQPDWGVFPMLFFVLSPTAMMIFDQKNGLRWLLVFTLVTGVVFWTVTDFLDGLATTLPYGAGYWFFGAFARALKTAEEAESELRETHRKLQDYAASVEELAVAEERNRLAREMHDTLGHRLTVAAVQLEGAQRLIPSDPNRAEGMVATVRTQVREALGELRTTVATLREPLTTDMNLVTSLSRLIDSFEQATDLILHRDLSEEINSLPHAYRLALYRAVQEALTNIQRHAQAKNVWISLKKMDDQIELKISDDGIGFPTETQETAFGLRGMRERVSHLNGKLAFESHENGGAWVRVTLPLPEDHCDD